MKNSDDNFIVTFWQNKRLRSAFFLLLWVIFIAFIIVNYAVPYEQEKAKYEQNETTNESVNEEENNTEIYFEDLKNSLLRYNFDYTYTVTTLYEKIIYKGTMLGNKTSGYKESSLGIEKYYVEGTSVYKEVLGERVLQSDKSTNVFDGYLSVDKIMDLLHDQEYVYEENYYDFQIDEVYVKIIVAKDNIASIEINNADNNYLLEFSNVNEVKELNY